MASSTNLQKLQDEAFLDRVRFFEEFLEADKVSSLSKSIFKSHVSITLNASKLSQRASLHVS